MEKAIWKPNHSIYKNNIKPKTLFGKIHRGNGRDWLYHWHSLIDALANGETVDDFFNRLLK